MDYFRHLVSSPCLHTLCRGVAFRPSPSRLSSPRTYRPTVCHPERSSTVCCSERQFASPKDLLLALPHHLSPSPCPHVPLSPFCFCPPALRRHPACPACPELVEGSLPKEAHDSTPLGDAPAKRRQASPKDLRWRAFNPPSPGLGLCPCLPPLVVILSAFFARRIPRTRLPAFRLTRPSLTPSSPRGYTPFRAGRSSVG